MEIVKKIHIIMFYVVFKCELDYKSKKNGI